MVEGARATMANIFIMPARVREPEAKNADFPFVIMTVLILPDRGIDSCGRGITMTDFES
jgi:hypothetical protein